jgi:hypothetical protein
MLGTKLLELRAKYAISPPITRKLMEHADIDLLAYTFGRLISEGKETFKETSKSIKEKYQYSDSWTRKQLHILIKNEVIGLRIEGRRHIYYMKSAR